MRSFSRAILLCILTTVPAAGIYAQADELCREFGETPTREIGRGQNLYVFGRVVLKGPTSTSKKPRVTVTYTDSLQPATRQPVGRIGNFCFKRFGSGGLLIVDLDGVEAARRPLSDIGPVRQREDFEIVVASVDQMAPPGVVSTRFSRPLNNRTADLYKQAAAAEDVGDVKRATEIVKEIVAIDRGDFIAWAKLGSLYMSQDGLAEAEAAFRRALELRGDYTPALINLGTLAAIQKYYPAAIAIFLEAVKADPSSARAYRLLGEAYLHNKQGTLGLAALDKALVLDPVGMAECHLLKARLYELAGARKLAASEYKAFLEKVPDYEDKNKLEKYVRENPPR
jgi:Tfp pilus assembly protein PilF